MDLILLIEDGLQANKTLVDVVRHVFTVRDTHPCPVTIPDPPPRWRQEYPEIANGLTETACDLPAALKLLRSFWSKALDDAGTSTEFMPTDHDKQDQLTIELPTQPRKKELYQTMAEISSAIKSIRDIMRKDAGINGDVDRLPQLSWLLFLHAFTERVDTFHPRRCPAPVPSQT